MAEPFYRANVLVCQGTGCTASKSPAVFSALADEIQRRGLQDEVRLVQTGCRGFCAMGPIVIVYPEGIFSHFLLIDDDTGKEVGRLYGHGMLTLSQPEVEAMTRFQNARLALDGKSLKRLQRDVQRIKDKETT